MWKTDARQAERADYRNPASAVIITGAGLSHSVDLQPLSSRSWGPAPYEPITLTVTLVDDSTVTGVVDAETDDQFLAIQSSTPGILLCRFVPWSQIVEADFGLEILTVDALKHRLKNVLRDKDARSVADTDHSLSGTDGSNLRCGRSDGCFCGPRHGSI